jgi:hypothetical protein
VAQSFKPPSKSLSPREIRLLAFAVIGVVVLSAGLAWVNRALGEALGGGGEFYTIWIGGRAFLFDKVDPYSGYVPAHVQELVYGKVTGRGDEPYILDVPFYLLLLFFPFSAFSDPALARALFTVLLELALFASIYLSLRLTDWTPARLFTAVFIIVSLLNFYVYQAILDSTPVLLLGLAYGCILLAMQAGRDEWIGALIALTFFYWEVGGPLLLLVLSRILNERRTGVLAGFGMLTFILMTASLLWYPGWIIPFLRATVNNLRADFGFSTSQFFNHIWPGGGTAIAWGLTALLVLVLGLEWSAARGADFRRFYWTACLTLAATPLLGFRTEMENLSVLLLPLAFVFAVAYQRWHRIGHGLVVLLSFLVVGIPWVLDTLGRERFGSFARDLVFIFLPVSTILGLYWIRWWAILKPHTWLDRARRPI